MDDTRSQNSGQRSASLRIMLGLAVIVAATVCAWRGPYRALSNPSDFILIYSPARAWLTGGNPYDMTHVDRAWLDAHGPADQAPTKRQTPGLLYPPTTLVGLSPFAALTWPLAHYAWIAANIAAFALTLWCLAHLAGFQASQRRTWVFTAGALIFAPVHTTLHHGQTPLHVMAIALLGFVISKGAGGALIGLSAAVKPQIGLPMIALEVVRRRWRRAGAAVIALALMLLIATLPMMSRGIRWWHSWTANLEAFRTTGAGDFSAANPDRHQMVNLQYPLTALTENKPFAGLAALAVCASLAAVFFLPPKKRMAQTPLLLSLSMVAVLSLMVAYHRFYDAVLLLVPMAWAIGDVARQRSSGAADPTRGTVPAWCMLALLVPFLLNSSTALVWLNKTGRLPEWLVQSWSWEHVLLPLQGWAILAMALCLLVSQRRIVARASQV